MQPELTCAAHQHSTHTTDHTYMCLHTQAQHTPHLLPVTHTNPLHSLYTCKHSTSPGTPTHSTCPHTPNTYPTSHTHATHSTQNTLPQPRCKCIPPTPSTVPSTQYTTHFQKIVQYSPFKSFSGHPSPSLAKGKKHKAGSQNT